MSNYSLRKSELSQAVSRLEEALNQPFNEYIRDSSIQRFEFCFELAWKTIQAYLLETNAIEADSPRSVIKEAYRTHLIDNESDWLNLISIRNKTTHTYNQSLADEVFRNLPDTIQLFKSLIDNLNT